MKYLYFDYNSIAVSSKFAQFCFDKNLIEVSVNL